MPRDPIAICAQGEAAWHACAYAGLGQVWHTDEELAWAPRSPHDYLFGAITLTPRPPLPVGVRLGQSGSLRDSWAALTEADLPGWSPVSASPWMWREPTSCEVDIPAGVTVEQTDDALLFEATVFLANESAPGKPGELHPAGSQRLPGLSLFLAWRDGRPIGTALSVTHATGVFISAVAVLPGERRRGVGRLLTATGLRTAPELPATLTASAAGLSTYLRLGFQQLAEPVQWSPGRRTSI